MSADSVLKEALEFIEYIRTERDSLKEELEITAAKLTESKISKLCCSCKAARKITSHSKECSERMLLTQREISALQTNMKEQDQTMARYELMMSVFDEKAAQRALHGQDWDYDNIRQPRISLFAKMKKSLRKVLGFVSYGKYRSTKRENANLWNSYRTLAMKFSQLMRVPTDQQENLQKQIIHEFYYPQNSTAAKSKIPGTTIATQTDTVVIEPKTDKQPQVVDIDAIEVVYDTPKVITYMPKFPTVQLKKAISYRADDVIPREISPVPPKRSNKYVLDRNLYMIPEIEDTEDSEIAANRKTSMTDSGVDADSRRHSSASRRVSFAMN